MFLIVVYLLFALYAAVNRLKKYVEIAEYQGYCQYIQRCQAM